MLRAAAVEERARVVYPMAVARMAVQPVLVLSATQSAQPL